jgi:hypothetical protein
MKVISLLILAAAMAPLAGAQIKIPKDMAALDKWEAARVQAQTKRELLLFIKVNPAVEADHVHESFGAYVKAFKSYGPMVLVPLDAKEEGLPAGAQQGFKSMSGGYPQLVAVDPDTLGLVQSVPYAKITDRDETLKTHRKEMHKYITDKKKRPRVVATPIPTPTTPGRLW